MLLKIYSFCSAVIHDDVRAVDSLATGDMNKLSQQSWTIWGPCRQLQNAHTLEDDITCVWGPMKPFHVALASSEL